MPLTCPHCERDGIGCHCDTKHINENVETIQNELYESLRCMRDDAATSESDRDILFAKAIEQVLTEAHATIERMTKIYNGECHSDSC